MIIRAFLAATAVAILASPAPAAVKLAPMSVGCTGVFGLGATRESLTEEFGAAVVHRQYSLDGDRDYYDWESRVYPNGAQDQEAMVRWNDPTGSDATKADRARGRKVEVFVSYDQAVQPIGAHVQWQTAAGIHLGMTVAEIEAMNGKPFLIAGNQGSRVTILDWDGGKLATPDGGCSTSIELDRDRTGEPERKGRYEDCIICGVHRSDEDLVRNWKGAVSSFEVNYPDEPSQP